MDPINESKFSYYDVVMRNWLVNAREAKAKVCLSIQLTFDIKKPAAIK